MWKSTSSIDESTLIVWEDLGSSPKYANCVLFICFYFFKYMLSMIMKWYNHLIILVIMKHELVKWLNIDLAFVWLWVQVLEKSN